MRTCRRAAGLAALLTTTLALALACDEAADSVNTGKDHGCASQADERQDVGQVCTRPAAATMLHAIARPRRLRCRFHSIRSPSVGQR